MIQDQIAPLLRAAILAAQQAGSLPAFEISAIPVERPKQEEHGDFATPVALQVTKTARLAPQKIASAIIEHLPLGPDSMLASAEIAGPGFINLRLGTPWLVRHVDSILDAGERYADPDIGHGRPAQVEFISANPTGPLTVGHGRGAVIGDTLGNLLQAGGYAVSREYYFNDGGLQMKILAESVRLRARQQLGEEIEFPADHYQGDYISAIAADLLAERGPDAVSLDWTVLRDYATAAIFAEIRRTLDRLGIHFDVYFNEMSLFDLERPGNIWEIVEALRERDMAYEADGAIWFRATAFGADKDRVLVRSSGEPTYRLPDIAYHVDKLKRGFDLVVNVLGADHIAQYPDIQAAVGSLGYDSSKLHVVTNQFVTLVRDGKPVKMSTRRATYVTLDELLDEVGVDAMRYFMISRSPDSQFEFDLNLAAEQSEKNPALYIQYAHARTAGILLRRAAEKGISFDPRADLSPLGHPAEIALIHQILRLEETLVACIRRLEPQHLAFYATDLATTFNVFYRDCYVLDPENIPLSQARLKLVKATQIALARALHLMGMQAPDEM